MRGSGAYNMVMDLDLLSSPQLYSLEYTLLEESDDPFRHEPPILARLMKDSKRLRILHLGYEREKRFHFEDYYRFYAKYGSDGQGFNNLPFNAFTTDDSIAPLQELKFLSEPYRGAQSNYDFTDSHCNAWRFCMDWSKLRTPNLGAKEPSPFFKIFRGYVPNLKSLSFTLTRGGPQSIGVNIVRIIGDFVDYIEGLEKICITNATNGFFPILWTYVQKHGSTLRALKTTNIGSATGAWTRYSLEGGG